MTEVWVLLGFQSSEVEWPYEWGIRILGVYSSLEKAQIVESRHNEEFPDEATRILKRPMS